MKDAASHLVQKCLGNPNATVTDMLREIARQMDAFGCIIWELAPEGGLQQTCFMLGSWFDTESDDVFAMHNLPLKTITGKAITTGETQQCDDVQTEGGERRHHPFLVRHRVGPICSVPFAFADGRPGTVDVLRKCTSSRFTDEERSQFENLAQLVPLLYQALRDRHSLALVQDVDRVIADVGLAEGTVDLERKRTVLGRIAARVAETFHAMEVSIFLEDRLESPGGFDLQATTWNDSEFKRRRYLAEPEGYGKTGYCLASRKPILIVDHKCVVVCVVSLVRGCGC